MAAVDLVADAMPRPVQRVALVSGGVGGLGSGICAALAHQGHRVVAVDLPAEGERLDRFREHTSGLDVRLEVADVGDFAACGALVDRIERDFGAVDILVNAAGITRDTRLANMDPAQWDDVLRVNLDGVFNLCRHAVTGMVQRGFGRIVNISSVNGQTGQFGQTTTPRPRRACTASRWHWHVRSPARA